MCNSIMSENVGVFHTSSSQWKTPISDNTSTMSDGSTSNATFGERNTGEYIVATSVSDSDTTDNTPTVDHPDCREGNATDTGMNTPVGDGLPDEASFAVYVINRVQLAITCAGFFANAATYLTLASNVGRFSPLILLLIKHQSLLDMAACGMGSLYLFLPTGNWLTGIRIVDFVVCHGWHIQSIFWTCFSISTWNLVLIGVERYVMICKPFLYLSVTRRLIFYTLAVLYVGCLVCLIPSYIQIDFVDGECLHPYNSEGFSHYFYYGYSFFIMFAFYILPVAAFVFIYGYVAYTLFASDS